MESKNMGQEYNQENYVRSYKVIYQIGEGRILDDKLVNQLKEIALSPSITFATGEKEFFLSILNQPDLMTFEDWQLVKFIRIAEKANVKIILPGKPHLNVVSSEESRGLLVKTLRKSYRQENRIKLRHVLEDGNTPQDISQTYVNLAIVMKQRQVFEEKKTKEKSVTFNDKRMKSSYEQIYGTMEDFPINQLWSAFKKGESNEKQENKIPRKVLIAGWAGIGKTVLCQYLAILWAQDVKEIARRWWSDDTQLVLWIRLRNLTNYDPQHCSLGEVVRRECFGVEDSKNRDFPSAIQIEADLEALGDKVVLLLDGFDEVAGLYQKYVEYLDDKRQQRRNLTAQSELLTHVLFGNRHRHRMIVTSRPSSVGKIERNFERKLETIGFKDIDIENYVKKYFIEHPNEGELLLKNMKLNSNLWGIGHIPLNLALVCLVWKERSKTKEKKEIKEIEKREIDLHQKMTMTTLYSEAVLWLLRRDWVKHPIEKEKDPNFIELTGEEESSEEFDEDYIRQRATKLPLKYFEVEQDQYSKKLRLLEEVAWFAQLTDSHELLIPGRQIIKSLTVLHGIPENDESKLKNILRAIKKLGLLENEYNLDKVNLEKNNFYFPHLTFQEYFAAKYWVRKYCSQIVGERKEAEKLFKQNKYYRRFEIVWWFASGLLIQQSPDDICNFFKLLEEEPREIIGMRHMILLIRCLEESSLLLRDDLRALSSLELVIQWVKWLGEVHHGLLDDSMFFFHAMSQSRAVCTHPMVVNYYVNALNTEDKDKIKSILLSLYYMPPTNCDLINKICQLSRAEDEDIRGGSLEVICRIPYKELVLTDFQPNEIIKALLNSLKDVNANERIRALAVNGLSQLHWEKLPEVDHERLFETILSCHQDKYKNVRIAAINTLPELHWERITEDKRKRLLDSILARFENEDEHWDIKAAIVEVLAKLPWKLLSNIQYLALFNSLLCQCLSEDSRIPKALIPILFLAPFERICDIHFEILVNIVRLRYISIKPITKRWREVLSGFWNRLYTTQREILLNWVSEWFENKKAWELYCAVKIQPTLSWELLSEYQRDSMFAKILACRLNNESYIRQAVVEVLIQLWGSLSELQRQEVRKVVFNMCEDKDSQVQLTSVSLLLVFCKEKMSVIECDTLFNCIVAPCFNGEDNLKKGALILMKFLPWERLSDTQHQTLLDTVIDMCKNEKNDKFVRIAAIDVLCLFQWKQLTDIQSQALLKCIIVSCKDKEESVQVSAIKILSALSWEQLSEPQFRALLGAILGQCRDKNIILGREATTVLFQLPWKKMSHIHHTDLLNSLLGLCKDENSWLKETIVWNLGRLPWKMLTKEQRETLLNSVLKFCQDRNMNLQWMMFLFLPKLPLKLMSDSQCQELLNMILDMDKNSEHAIQMTALYVLPELPIDMLTEAQRKKLIDFVLVRCWNGNWGMGKAAIHTLKRLAWWKCYDQTLHVDLLVRCCLYTESVLYYDTQSKYIKGLNSQDNQILIEHEASSEQIPESLEKARKDLKIPEMLRIIPKEKPLRLSQSRDRIILQGNVHPRYECLLEGVMFYIQIQIHNYLQKIRILIDAPLSISLDQKIVVKEILISFLRKIFKEDAITIEYSYGTSFQVTADQVKLEDIKKNICAWLENDFPTFYLNEKINISSGCFIC